MKCFGLLLTALTMTGVASAAVAVPEIDGNSVVSGVALISGVLLVARGRRK